MMVDVFVSSAHVDQLLSDPYGNYVFQSALDSLPVEIGTRLVVAVRDQLGDIKHTASGRRILSKIQRKYSAVFTVGGKVGVGERGLVMAGEDIDHTSNSG